MAISWMTSAEDDSVRPFLKSTENEHGIYPAGTRNPDDLYIRRIPQSAASCQIRSGITAPVAAERDNFWSEFFFLFYRHMASTSAMICRLENPCRSIAPEGQVTVQAPQPWHRALFTTATRRVSRIPWSFTCFSSYVMAP